jgi:DUF2889 family protein
MELFRRSKDYRVDWDEAAGSFTATVDMRDAFHDIGVEVVFSYPELVITSVDARMDRTPYPICPAALSRARSCIGLRVAPAMSLMLDRQIGGPEGCSHVTNLVLDACHAAVQGLLAIRRRRLDVGEAPLPAGEKVAYLQQFGLPTRDSCVAYVVPSGVADA